MQFLVKRRSVLPRSSVKPNTVLRGINLTDLSSDINGRTKGTILPRSSRYSPNPQTLVSRS